MLASAAGAGQAQTYHFHLASYAVANGQAVAQGQQIGTTGSTGNSSGPHLGDSVVTTLAGPTLVHVLCQVQGDTVTAEGSPTTICWACPIIDKSLDAFGRQARQG